MASIRKAEEKKLSLTIFLQFAACDVWIVWSLDHRKEGRDWEGSNKEFSSRPFACSFFSQSAHCAKPVLCNNSWLQKLPPSFPGLKFGAKIYGGKLGVENWGQKIWGQKLGVENLGQKIWGGKLGRQITSKFSTTIFLPENILLKILTFFYSLPETSADDLEIVIKQRYWRNISECVWRLTQWSHYYYCPFHAGLIIRRIHLFINSWLPSNVPHNFTT